MKERLRQTEEDSRRSAEEANRARERVKEANLAVAEAENRVTEATEARRVALVERDTATAERFEMQSRVEESEAEKTLALSQTSAAKERMQEIEEQLIATERRAQVAEGMALAASGGVPSTSQLAVGLLSREELDNPQDASGAIRLPSPVGRRGTSGAARRLDTTDVLALSPAAATALLRMEVKRLEDEAEALATERDEQMERANRAEEWASRLEQSRHVDAEQDLATVAAALEKVDNLSTRAVEAEAETQRAIRNEQDLRARLELAEAETLSTHEEAKAAWTRASAAEERAVAAVESMAECEERCRTAEAKLEAAASAIVEAQERATAAEKEAMLRGAELVDVGEKAAELRGQLSAVSSQADAERAEWATERSRLASELISATQLAAQADSSERALVAERRRVHNLERQVRLEEEQGEELERAMNHQISLLSSTLADAQAKLNQTEADLEKTRLELSHLKDVESRLVAMSSAKATATSDASAAREEAAALRRQVERAKEDVVAAQDRAHREIDHLRREVSSTMQQESLRAEKDLEEAARTVEMLRRREAAVVERVGQVEEELGAQRRRTTQVEETLERERREWASLKAHLEGQVGAAKEAASLEEAALGEERRGREREVGLLKTEVERLMDELSKQEEARASSVARLQTSFSEASTRATDAEMRAEKLNAELEVAKAANRDQTTLVKDLSSTLQAVALVHEEHHRQSPRPLETNPPTTISPTARTGALDSAARTGALDPITARTADASGNVGHKPTVNALMDQLRAAQARAAEMRQRAADAETKAQAVQVTPLLRRGTDQASRVHAREDDVDHSWLARAQARLEATPGASSGHWG